MTNAHNVIRMEDRSELFDENLELLLSHANFETRKEMEVVVQGRLCTVCRRFILDLKFI